MFRQVVLCQKQIKQQHDKDKRTYANMFQKFAERDSKVRRVLGWGVITTFSFDVPDGEADAVCLVLLLNRKQQRR